MLLIARRTPSNSSTQGFSLVELSVVVAILSVVAVLGLEMAANFVNRTAGSITKDRLAVVDEATARFFKIYGRLPCPSALDLVPTAAAYGLENCSTAGGAGNPVILNSGGTGNGLYAGAVPFRTLNLPMSYSIDGFSDKLNYVVTRNLTVAGGSTSIFNRFSSSGGTLAQNGVGAIEVRTGMLVDANNCNANNCQIVATVTTSATAPGDGAAYLIFSNGSDKRGAYSARGVAQASCIPSPTASFNQRPDSQNCVMGNTTTRNNITTYTGGTAIPYNVFYDNRYNAGLNLKSYFDDYVVWRPKAQL